MGDPAGEADKGALRLDFDRRLLLQFRGSAITSDAGLLPYRELDDALDLTDTGADRLADARTGKNGRHRLVRVAASIGIRAAGRLRGCERRRAAVPRPGDALGSRRPGDHRLCRLSQPDGPLRDEVAEPTGEPCCARRPARPVDRQGEPAATAEEDRARHGFEREPDLWRAGRQCLQRPLCLYLLPSAVRVQPTRRC